MQIIPPDIILEAYSQGIFPMADTRYSKSVDWYFPKRRGIIEIDAFHTSKNLKRLIRQGKYKVKVNANFRRVMENCANRPETWINDLIINTYQHLHELGHANSVEVYLKNELVGGLYGVHLGAAFFGESMFKTAPEADKVALYYCHKILQLNDFMLWDTQFYTEHLGHFGCTEIPSDEYLDKLEMALKYKAGFTL